ncbi:MAG: hypothetical protein ACTSRI_18295 [Promethearchaeota archaeon]
MAFCGNIVELVEKQKVLDDGEFIQWTDTNVNNNINSNGNHDIEVYVEKTLISELEEKALIIIDAAIGEMKGGEKIGMLLMKKENDVYG